MAVPIVAAKAARKFGPGSRGANAGKPKAADELARRAAARKAAAAPAPATVPPAAEPKTPGSSPEGGFLTGLKEGASQGRSLKARGGSTVRDGSGVLLGFLAWVWVVLPYLDGGLPRVRQVLAAKFLNQGPDGAPL